MGWEVRGMGWQGEEHYEESGRMGWFVSTNVHCIKTTVSEKDSVDARTCIMICMAERGNCPVHVPT